MKMHLIGACYLRGNIAHFALAGKTSSVSRIGFPTITEISPKVVSHCARLHLDARI